MNKVVRFIHVNILHLKYGRWRRVNVHKICLYISKHCIWIFNYLSKTYKGKNLLDISRNTDPFSFKMLVRSPFPCALYFSERTFKNIMQINSSLSLIIFTVSNVLLLWRAVFNILLIKPLYIQLFNLIFKFNY